MDLDVLHCWKGHENWRKPRPIQDKYENVYIVYLLSPLTTTDFRISDGIREVVNANIA